jgi:hypothetical protein
MMRVSSIWSNSSDNLFNFVSICFWSFLDWGIVIGLFLIGDFFKLVHFDIFDIQLNVLWLEGKYIAVEGLHGLFYKFNSHFYRLVGT